MKNAICELCNKEMERYYSIYGTREIIKSKSLWKSIISDQIAKEGHVQNDFLELMLGHLGSKDDIWQLCEGCSGLLSSESIFPIAEQDLERGSRQSICMQKGFNTFVVHDSDVFKSALIIAKTVADDARTALLKKDKTNIIEGQYNIDSIGFEKIAGNRDGIFLLKSKWDEDESEEACIIIRDQTPFVNILKNTKPFRLITKSAIVKTTFGNLITTLFWIEDQNSKTISMWEWYWDFSTTYYYDFLLKLSSQAEFILFLLGKDNKKEKLFKFENTYDFLSILKLTGEGTFINQQETLQDAIIEYQSGNSVEELFDKLKRTK